MIGSDNRVLGTVEAGFRNREHRRFIYEQDVRILEEFVGYATVALEYGKWVMLDHIRHDWRSALGIIRENTDMLLDRLDKPDQKGNSRASRSTPRSSIT